MLNKIPPVVSQRNQFSPADEFVDNALPFLPDQFKHEHFRKWLTTYTESVIKNVAHHFGVAAQRGIEQAANLLCDPGFYETRRRRRTKEAQKMRESQAQQDWERIERRECPTAEQIQEQVAWRERQVGYHQSQIVVHETELARLRRVAPKNIRFVPKQVQ